MDIRDVLQVFRTVPEAHEYLAKGKLCVPYMIVAPREDLDLIKESIVDLWITQHFRVPLKAWAECPPDKQGLLFGMNHPLVGRNGMLSRVHSVEGVPVLMRVTRPSGLQQDQLTHAGLNFLAWTPMMGPSLKGSFLWEEGKVLQPDWSNWDDVAMKTPTLRALHYRGVKFNPTKPPRVV